MATLPKIRYKGKNVNEKQVLTFKYEGVEAFTGKYIAEKKALNVVCYHKHQGKPDQSEANGCYTAKTAYGGYCRGYTVEVANKWGCGYCGQEYSGSSHPTYCSNRACYNNGHATSNWSVHGTSKKTDYHPSASGCGEWTYYYKYNLGCGYDAE